MQLFSQHVSQEVANTLWQQRDRIFDGKTPLAQHLIATVLFADLEGFSRISERMDPERLMHWLNLYIESLTKVVMEHGGVVDDYAGDGVKVNFGVPVPRTTDADIRRDALNAVNASLVMEKEMVRLNAMMKEQNSPTTIMRIGICTGAVIAGTLGTDKRMKYTTMGDTVNIASRLETLGKDVCLSPLAQGPCRIVIADSTLRYLDNKFKTERVGELSLRGKEQQIMAYCVVGRNVELE
jgi:adenylate cyclase